MRKIYYTISRTLRRVGLYGRVARRKPLLSAKNKMARFEFAKRHVGDSQNVWRKVLWSDETKIELFGHQRKRYVCRKPITSPKEHHPHSETWWWQHHAVGMVFFW